MTDSEPSRVFFAEESDPEMQRAYARARETFRYCWREIAWEKRRVVPGLDFAYVKAAFSDGEEARNRSGTPTVEHMWLSDVDFDGRFVTGVLLNEPTWLRTARKGDAARVAPDLLSDWMYKLGPDVFGAYTVNLLRSRMSAAERRAHDGAWGLDFGDPAKIRVVPGPTGPGGRLKGWFARPDQEPGEHPMSVAMAPSLQAQLAKDPSLVRKRDERGWTFLHEEALAGSAATVKVLLDAGADRSALTNDGMTAGQLARSLGWTRVIDLLGV